MPLLYGSVNLINHFMDSPTQWRWPDTESYDKATRKLETETAKTRRYINRCFLGLGIACLIAMGLMVLFAYLVIHK